MDSAAIVLELDGAIEQRGLLDDEAEEGSCRVRMQRVGEKLLVEDNSGCGGAAVEGLRCGFWREA